MAPADAIFLSFESQETERNLHNSAIREERSSRKRHLNRDDIKAVSLIHKRKKLDDDDLMQLAIEATTGTEPSLTTAAVIPVSDSNLAADGSRDLILPTVSRDQSDVKVISAKTFTELDEGVDKHDHVTILDCRSPSDFILGHTWKATNVHDTGSAEVFMRGPTKSNCGRRILVLYCDDVGRRSKIMYRTLRHLDRKCSPGVSGRLQYPEMYVVDGGYSAICRERDQVER